MFEHGVSILLSTYNGSKFLREQLDSLLAQSFENYIIWVRDDGSMDSTKAIIEEYKVLYPNKFNLVDWESSRNLGFGASFLRLLEVANGDLYFYCDQDDIWFQNKLEIMTSHYQNCEGKTTPCLLHSDMAYTGDGTPRESSFFDQTNYLSVCKDKFLFRGYLPGCSMALNNELKKVCLGSDYKLSHDFLAYFMAKTYGKLELINFSLLQYRVHNGNTVGLGKSTSIVLLLKDWFKYVFDSNAYRRVILSDYYILANEMRSRDNSIIEKEVYVSEELTRLGFFKRKKWYYSHFVPFDKGIIEGLIKLSLV